MTENDFSLLQILIVLIKKKYFFIANFLFVFIGTIIVSFLLPKQYKSTISFIPPGQSSSGLLSMLGNNYSPDMLVGSDLSKRQYVALLRSRELREKLIQKFDLIKVYQLEKAINKWEMALKYLNNSIIIKENEEGGLGVTDVISVEVDVIDKNAQRASDMANELFRLLEEKAIYITQRESNLQIEFLKKQQTINDSMLSKARNELVNFQRSNRMYDISSQARLTVQAISQLEADKMSFELQKSYLQQSFSSQNLVVSAIDDKIAIYNRKIAELEKKNNQSLTPGLQKSLDLADRFTDLHKEVETYFQLNISLRHQFEIAKIKQQKSYIGISLIDSARPAEYKFKPKRSIFVVVITMIYMMIILTWVLFKEYYLYLKTTHPGKVNKLLKAIKEK